MSVIVPDIKGIVDFRVNGNKHTTFSVTSTAKTQCSTCPFSEHSKIWSVGVPAHLNVPVFKKEVMLHNKPFSCHAHHDQHCFGAAQIQTCKVDE